MVTRSAPTPKPPICADPVKDQLPPPMGVSTNTPMIGSTQSSPALCSRTRSVGPFRALVATHGAKVVYGMFTAPTDDSRGLYDFEKYTVGAALGWGGAQLRDNLYESSPNFPAEGCYSATFEDPDNGAFWSFTVYDENGFMFDDVAHMSSDIAAANEDGTYTVSMGCGADAVNNLPISNESGVFNFTVRHYIPSDRVKFDEYRLMPLMQKVD